MWYQVSIRPIPWPIRPSPLSVQQQLYATNTITYFWNICTLKWRRQKNMKMMWGRNKTSWPNLLPLDFMMQFLTPIQVSRRVPPWGFDRGFSRRKIYLLWKHPPKRSVPGDYQSNDDIIIGKYSPVKLTGSLDQNVKKLTS